MAKRWANRRQRLRVDFGDQHPLRAVARELFHFGSDHAAWGTPGSPEVDQDGQR